VTPIWRQLRWVLLGGAALVYIVLGFLASSSEHPPLYAVLVGAVPVAAGLLAAAWRAPWRYAATLLCLAAFAAIGWHIDILLSHAAWLYFVQHAATMIALGCMFGITLGTHAGALCSRIARFAVAETLDADYLYYTWKVTLVWTVYFALSALISLGLFFGASLEAWSWFAAVVTPVSLGVMFAGEYAIRLRALPGRPHFSVAQTIQSYRSYTQRRDCIE
jgi:uncharacterized membrane protein